MAATQESLEALDERDARALTQKMTVLEDLDRARGAPGLYVVVTESGRSYLVDVDGDVCECDDSLYRGVECKHVRRAKFATGQRDIPSWANRDRVDPQLGEHVDGGGSA